MIAALIPARGGSKGIPGKNIHMVQGHPLIAYSIAAAKLARSIDMVIVSTDSEEIANVARTYGAQVPFLRPAELAQDHSPDSDFVLHALSWFEHLGTVPEFLVHLRPTTPLRDPVLIDQAIAKFEQTPNATSLRSAHLASESPFKWFLLQENGFYTGLTTQDMDTLNGARQQFPSVYIPNGYVDVLRTSFVQATKKLHGDRVLSFISQACTEIDTLADLAYLDFEVTQTQHMLVDYLDSMVNTKRYKQEQQHV